MTVRGNAKRTSKYCWDAPPTLTSKNGCAHRFRYLLPSESTTALCCSRRGDEAGEGRGGEGGWGDDDVVILFHLCWRGSAGLDLRPPWPSGFAGAHRPTTRPGSFLGPPAERQQQRGKTATKRYSDAPVPSKHACTRPSGWTSEVGAESDPCGGTVTPASSAGPAGRSPASGHRSSCEIQPNRVLNTVCTIRSYSTSIFPSETYPHVDPHRLKNA